MAEGSSSKVLCTFCLKPAVKRRVLCLNCKQYAHNSCAGFGKSKVTKVCSDSQSLFEENSSDAANSGDLNKEDMNTSGEVFYSDNEDEGNSGINENLQKRICVLEQENQILRELLEQEKKTHLSVNKTKNEELERLKSDIDQTLKSVLTKIQEFEIKFDMQNLSRSHKNPADDRPLENMETKTAELTPRNKTWLHPVHKNKQSTGQQKQLKSVVKVRTVHSKKQSKDITVIVPEEKSTQSTDDQNSNWEIVSHKKSNKNSQRFIIGKKDENSTVKVVPKKGFILVSRLDPKTKPAEVC